MEKYHGDMIMKIKNRLYCEQVKSTDIEVTEYETPETERNRYVAEFEYKKLHYCLSGELTKEEIENILKNLYFCKNASVF